MTAEAEVYGVGNQFPVYGLVHYLAYHGVVTSLFTQVVEVSSTDVTSALGAKVKLKTILYDDLRD